MPFSLIFFINCKLFMMIEATRKPRLSNMYLKYTNRRYVVECIYINIIAFTHMNICFKSNV